MPKKPKPPFCVYVKTNESGEISPMHYNDLVRTLKKRGFKSSWIKLVISPVKAPTSGSV